MTRNRQRWTIDAIEDDVARVEVDGERIVSLPAWLLPEHCAEGEVLTVVHDRAAGRSRLTVVRDARATRQAIEESARQLEGMPPGGDGGGDVAL